MASSDLAGDGISLAFFDLLWKKAEDDSSCLKLRLPDTVLISHGVPSQYFFTSTKQCKDGNPVILRKRKQNVTLDNIFDLFCRKSSTGPQGKEIEHDVVAYFIASADCTSRFRRKSVGATGDANDDANDADNSQNTDNGYSAPNTCNSDDAQCDIEYFDRDGLRRFLQGGGRKNQTGILQRFIKPSGGGTHNSLIQAIWTPNLCLMERRRTKQGLHDTRFGLYERTVTFEGPDVHSTSKPVRGTVLGNKVKGICNDIAHHVSEVTAGASLKKSRAGATDTGKLARMVVYFKVDVNEDIWLLFTSSLRLDDTITEHHLTNFSSPWNLHKDSWNSVDAGVHGAPLNIDTIVKLGPTIKLNPNANHDPTKVLENEITLTYCPSCGLDVPKDHFHPVPYKTIISHFEHAIDMIKRELSLDGLTEWPPDPQHIKAAGGVGFGSYTSSTRRQASSKNDKAISELPEEHTVIPPVIRQLHSRLKAQGYRRYRNDPLFLHKNCNVCENCFLAYAQLASTSFQMINPSWLDEYRGERQSNRGSVKEEDEEQHLNSQYYRHHDNEEKKSRGLFDSQRTQQDGKKSIGMVLCGAPSLPPVILDPDACMSAKIGSTMRPNDQDPIEMDFLSRNINRRRTELLVTDHAYQREEMHHPLQHLITSYEMMEQAKKEAGRAKSARPTCTSRTKGNPYAVDQKLIRVEPRGKRKDHERRT